MINKLVSIRQPIFDAFESMGKEVTNDLPVFARWAAYAAKDISSIYSYKKKISVLKVKGCSAELPCGAVSVKAVMLGDFGTNCGTQFSNYYSSIRAPVVNTIEQNTAMLTVDVNSGNCSSSSTNWTIQDNHIVFDSGTLDGSKITIQYIGFDLDETGLPMVSENAAPAIIEYIMWKYCIRSRFGKEKMDLADIQMHEREYHRLCSDARAIDGQLSEQEYYQVAAMINDPLVGWGLGITLQSPFQFQW